MNVKIYKLVDPDTLQIRYVGKTKNTLTKRLYEHLTKRNLVPNNHKNNWIKSLLEKGKKPLIETIEEPQNSEWQAREGHWIALLRKEGHPLTNSTVGGDGCIGFKKTQEQIQKEIEIRRKNGTLARSDECRRKIREYRSSVIISERQLDILRNCKKRTLVQISLDKIVVREWHGVRKCCESLGICRTSLWSSIKKRIAYKGFFWEFK